MNWSVAFVARFDPWHRYMAAITPCLQITKMGERAPARTLEEMVEGGRHKIEQRLQAQRDAAVQKQLRELTSKPERAATKAAYPEVQYAVNLTNTGCVVHIIP